MIDDDLRQKMIDVTQTDKKLSPEEKEVTARVGKRDDRITVFSEIRTVTKSLLAHPEFDIEWIRQSTSDGSIRIDRDDIPEEFDGRRTVVAVRGSMPIGTLLFKGQARSSNGLSQTVSLPVDNEFDLSIGAGGEGGE